MDETTTNIWDINKSIVITIPSKLLEDSAFPFKIERDENNVMITKNVTIKIDRAKKALLIFETKEASK